MGGEWLEAERLEAALRPRLRQWGRGGRMEAECTRHGALFIVSGERGPRMTSGLRARVCAWSPGIHIGSTAGWRSWLSDIAVHSGVGERVLLGSWNCSVR